MEDRADIGRFTKDQTGAADLPSNAASRPRNRWFRNMRAVFDIRAEIRSSGRARTPIGTRATISRQSCQRWNCARLSAPMSQTNRTPAYRCCNAAIVWAVARVPRCASMSVTVTDGCCMIWRAIRIRSSSGAGPRSLSGLCGLTSHHTRSSPNRCNAALVIRTCPSWAGSNDPPSSPTT